VKGHAAFDFTIIHCFHGYFGMANSPSHRSL